jgi:hypothetical protein
MYNRHAVGVSQYVSGPALPLSVLHKTYEDGCSHRAHYHHPCGGCGGGDARRLKPPSWVRTTCEHAARCGLPVCFSWVQHCDQSPDRSALIAPVRGVVEYPDVDARFRVVIDRPALHSLRSMCLCRARWGPVWTDRRLSLMNGPRTQHLLCWCLTCVPVAQLSLQWGL